MASGSAGGAAAERRPVLPGQHRCSCREAASQKGRPAGGHEANQKAIEAAGLSFILGMRIPHVPYVVSRWRREHPGEEIPDGHIFTQPRPAGPTGGRRNQVIYYQYKVDRASRTLRGIDEQVRKAEQAVAGNAPVKRNRFIQLSGGTRSVNRELEDKARALAGRSCRRRRPRSHRAAGERP